MLVVLLRALPTRAFSNCVSNDNTGRVYAVLVNCINGREAREFYLKVPSETVGPEHAAIYRDMWERNEKWAKAAGLLSENEIIELENES